MNERGQRIEVVLYNPKEIAEILESITQENAVTEQEWEKKSKRVNLLVKPSIYEDLCKIATMKRTSVNNLINVIASEYATANADIIEKYNKSFGEE